MSEWLLISETPPPTMKQSKVGFLGLTECCGALEWLQDDGEVKGKYFNVNSGNFTDKNHWKWWMPLPKAPSNSAYLI